MTMNSDLQESLLFRLLGRLNLSIPFEQPPVDHGIGIKVECSDFLVIVAAMVRPFR
ncbi:MAG: hypothetical protein RL145_347 [Pseudomonadota bacterium]